MSASAAAKEAPRDLLHELAQHLYIELAGRIYSETGSERPKPQPKAVATMSFKLAEAFQAANYEVNPTAIAARDAKAKASVDMSKVELNLDLGGTGKPA